MKDLKILNLPCSRTLDKVLKTHNDPPGIQEDTIAKQHETYAKFKEVRLKQGVPVPLGVGALLYDETKVSM